MLMLIFVRNMSVLCNKSIRIDAKFTCFEKQNSGYFCKKEPFTQLIQSTFETDKFSAYSEVLIFEVDGILKFVET